MAAFSRVEIPVGSRFSINADKWREIVFCTYPQPAGKQPGFIGGISCEAFESLSSGRRIEVKVPGASNLVIHIKRNT